MSTETKDLAPIQRVAPPIAASTQQALGRVQHSVLDRVTNGARVVIPYANHFAQRLGHVGVVGVALCVFSAIAMLSTNAALREQLAGDTAALEQLTSTTGTAAPAATPATPQAQYSDFLSDLPTRDDLPKVMERIVGVSAAAGVQLEEGKYELAAVGKDGHIARYRMSFPIFGSYPQVRTFIDQALSTVPAMSLDGLRLQRREVGVGVVTAELDFEVFVRTGS